MSGLVRHDRGLARDARRTIAQLIRKDIGIMANTLRTLTVGIALLPTAPALLSALPQSPTPGHDVGIEWVRQYVSGFSPAFDYPYAIVVDRHGNAHVTGGSYGPNQLPDVTTIQYGPAGDTQWVRRYDGRGNSWDQGLAAALDEAGNVYVAGRTYSAATDFDYVTIKYDASGARQWVATYDGGGGDDSAVAVAVDPAGNVTVTGYSGGPGTFYDYATIQYDALGHERWIARFDGPGSTKDIASGLALDASGNVYVTGSSGEGSPNLSDYVTLKYDESGVEQWVARYSDHYDYATAIAVDASANVIVTGRSYHPGTYYDYATVKYDSLGAQKWVALYHGPGGSDDNAHAVKVDPSGNVYVTGESVGPGSSTDYATIKYAPTGALQWVRRYDGPGNTVDSAAALALDSRGNVHVTGVSRGAGLVDDFATLTYDSLGNEVRVVRYAGAGDTFDLATAIGVDPQGGVYVTGYSAQVGKTVFSTIKLVE